MKDFWGSLLKCTKCNQMFLNIVIYVFFTKMFQLLFTWGWDTVLTNLGNKTKQGKRGIGACSFGPIPE